MMTYRILAAALVASLSMGCATNGELPGVPRGISFAATPVYPNGYDLVAGGARKFDSEVLKAAWRLKAKQLANGRKFNMSPLTVHDTESIPYNPYAPVIAPIKGRIVRGSITIE